MTPLSEVTCTSCPKRWGDQNAQPIAPDSNMARTVFMSVPCCTLESVQTVFEQFRISPRVNIGK
jgi:hypothetical protein